VYYKRLLEKGVTFLFKADEIRDAANIFFTDNDPVEDIEEVITLLIMLYLDTSRSEIPKSIQNILNSRNKESEETAFYTCLEHILIQEKEAAARAGASGEKRTHSGDEKTGSKKHRSG